MDKDKLKAATQAVLKDDKGDDLTAEDREILGESPEDEAEEGAVTGPPAWAKIPEFGLDKKPFRMPIGKLISFVMVPASMTDRPSEGIDRQCLMWNLTVADEAVALKRARGETSRAQRELCMASIRAVDGNPANWTGAKVGDVLANNVRQFFDDIGPKGRLLVQNAFQKTHMIDDKEATRFFADCFVCMTST